LKWNYWDLLFVLLVFTVTVYEFDY
jgi:hypothetical protein